MQTTTQTTEDTDGSQKCCNCTKSKGCDWIVIIILVIIFLLIEVEVFPTHHQCVPGHGVNCGDDLSPRLGYPLKDETLDDMEVILACLILGYGWLIVIMYPLMIWKEGNDTFNHKLFWSKIEVFSRMGFFSAFLGQVITNFIKIYVGAPRPNFYAYIDDSPENAYRSFPSGHASVAMSITYLETILFCQSLQYSMRRRAIDQPITQPLSAQNPYSYFGLFIFDALRDNNTVSIFVPLIPFFFGLWASLTRIIDYYHHCSDVIMGIAIGMGSAYLSYLVFKQEWFGKLAHSDDMLAYETEKNDRKAHASDPVELKV